MPWSKGLCLTKQLKVLELIGNLEAAFNDYMIYGNPFYGLGYNLKYTVSRSFHMVTGDE